MDPKASMVRENKSDIIPLICGIKNKQTKLIDTEDGLVIPIGIQQEIGEMGELFVFYFFSLNKLRRKKVKTSLNLLSLESPLESWFLTQNLSGAKLICQVVMMDNFLGQSTFRPPVMISLLHLLPQCLNWHPSAGRLLTPEPFFSLSGSLGLSLRNIVLQFYEANQYPHLVYFGLLVCHVIEKAG